MASPFGNFGGPNYQQQAGGLVKQGFNAGAFDPNGSPMFNAQLQRQARMSSENQRQRGSTLARLVGLNPYQQQQAAYGQEMGNAGNTADYLNNSRFQELMGNRDFLRQLFQGRLQNQDQLQQLQMQQQFAKQQQGGGLGALAGGLLGSAIPGIGTALGSGLGGYLGGKFGGGQSGYGGYAAFPGLYGR